MKLNFFTKDSRAVYSSPALDVISVDAEVGFAVSDPRWNNDGTIQDSDFNDFGSY